MDRSDQIDTFTRIIQVSRETIDSLKIYEQILLKYNKNLNLIGKSTINEVWNRHFLDSAQVIDLIDKKIKTCLDIGSGAGFPGLVLAIICKDRNLNTNFNLLEKSRKKCIFLKEVCYELNLNAEIICQDIENIQKIQSDVLIARAFKPIPKIFEIIHKKINFEKKIVLFLGKKQKFLLNEVSKNWHIEYKQRNSVTSNDSLIIEIYKLEKIS